MELTYLPHAGIKIVQSRWVGLNKDILNYQKINYHVVLYFVDLPNYKLSAIIIDCQCFLTPKISS